MHSTDNTDNHWALQTASLEKLETRLIVLIAAFGGAASASLVLLVATLLGR